MINSLILWTLQLWNLQSIDSRTKYVWYFITNCDYFSGYVCRSGSACISMHINRESLIETITNNFNQKDSIFYIHALRVCKIHRDPVQSHRFPKHLPMDEFPTEEFKKYKMKKSKKCAVEKPVTVDYTAIAMIKLIAGEELGSSIHEIGSGVESFALAQGTLCPLSKRVPSMSILKSQPKVLDVIADLDSPSLSDTQVAQYFLSIFFF